MHYKTITACSDAKEERTVIYLHGWGGDASAFLFCAENLKDSYDGILVDFYGFGLTPEPETPLTVSDYADGVVEIMEKNGVRKAVFAGHSFGGRVAMEIAAKHPEKTVALALVDSAGLKPRRGAGYYVKVALHKLLKKLGGNGLKGSEDYRRLSPVMKATFCNVVNYDQTLLLKKIRCPVAVFWGENDTDTPPYMAKRLNRGIADSHVFWLKGGHFAYLEDSANFLTVFRAFLNGVFPVAGEAGPSRLSERK